MTSATNRINYQALQFAKAKGRPAVTYRLDDAVQDAAVTEALKATAVLPEHASTAVGAEFNGMTILPPTS